MILRKRKVLLSVILAAVIVGGTYLSYIGSRSSALIVTSRYPADYCTALLAAQSETPVLISSHMEEEAMWNAIMGLDVTDLYVISEPDSHWDIPDQLESSVKIHFMDPASGAAASAELADMARCKSDTVFLADANAGTEIVGAICSISADQGIPLLLTDAHSLSPEITQYLQQHKDIAHVYLIGDTFADTIASDLEAMGLQVSPIQSSDGPYINGILNSALAADAQNLTVVFHPDEALSAAFQCAVNDNAVLYVPEAVSDSQELYVTLRSFSHIASLTGTQPELTQYIQTLAGRAVERPFSLKDSGYEGAVFYVPHQDDETLFYSQVLMEAVAEFGPENIYAVLLTDGAASIAQRRDPIAGYLNGILDRTSVLLGEQGVVLSQEDRDAAASKLFSQARTNEYLAALRQMGITNVEIHVFPDGGLPEQIPHLQQIISAYAEKGNLIHFAYSPYYDLHEDHRAIGQALCNLSPANGGSLSSVQFIVKNEIQYDFEFMNAPNDVYAAHTSFLATQAGAAQIRAASDEYGIIQCDTETIARSIADLMTREGCSITEAIARSEAVKGLRLGIGIVSVGETFEALNLRTDHGTRITTLHEAFIPTE